MAEQSTPSPVAASAPPPPATIPEPQRPDPLAVQVAGAVQRLRREAGLSERAAARKLRTSQTQLRRMEDPRYLPSLRSLTRVAAIYGHRLSVEFTPIVAERKRPAPASGATPKPRTAPKASAPTRSVAPARAGAQRTGRAQAGRKGRGGRG